MCAHKMLHKLMAGVDDSCDRLKKHLFSFYSKKLQNIKSFLCFNLSSPHSVQIFFFFRKLKFSLTLPHLLYVVLLELNIKEQKRSFVCLKHTNSIALDC